MAHPGALHLIRAWQRLSPAAWIRIRFRQGFWKRFVGALITQTRNAVPRTVGVLPAEAAGLPEPAVALRIAQLIEKHATSEAGRDLAPAWIAVAALSNMSARFALYQWFSHLARDATLDDFSRGRAQKRADLWLGSIDRSPLTSPTDWAIPGAVVRQRHWLDVPDVFGDAELEALVDPDAGPTELGTKAADQVVILKSRAERHDDEDELGRSVLARLSQPLTLAGGGLDLRILQTALDLAFPWFSELTRRLLADARLVQVTAGNRFWIRPTLILGPPGIGKSLYARRLGAWTGLPVITVDGASSTDTLNLVGVSRTWRRAQPSALATTMSRSGIANPLVFVDEVDKAGGSDNGGRLVNALLSLLEPVTSRSFPEPYLLADLDFSYACWLSTANSVDQLPGPLLSRLAIVHVQGPGVADIEAVIAGIRTEIAATLQIRADDLPPVSAEADRRLRDAFRRGASLRRLRGLYEAALADAVEDFGQNRRSWPRKSH